MKTQSLFLQISLLKVDSAYAWEILSMLTVVLRCAQPLNKRDMHRLQIFLRGSLHLLPRLCEFLPVNKKIKFRMNSIYFKIFIYVHKNPFAPQAPDHMEKLAESLLQLSLQAPFANFKIKKL